MLDFFADFPGVAQYLKILTPSEYHIGYTKNVIYNDPFDVGYTWDVKNWGLHASVIWSIFSGKYQHGFEFSSSRVSPSLSVCMQSGMQIIGAMRKITGIEDLTAVSVENMLTIREVIASYYFYKHYSINESINFYIGSGIGLSKILQYQGFRKDYEDLYGMVRSVKVGISHTLKPGLVAYVGYGYRNNSWKYMTDVIYDEDGNGVVRYMQDFEFVSHGLEMGVKFIV
ncbi:MAG: hypothetical protein AB8U44_04325 [Aaplasma endosymbiont of Hyalomma asiaticum]